MTINTVAVRDSLIVRMTLPTPSSLGDGAWKEVGDAASDGGREDVNGGEGG
jgi:hypothetical protein